MQKFTILFTTFCLIFINAFGQTPELSDLLKMLECEDEKCFEELIINQGFEYQTKNENEKFSAYYYQSIDKMPLASNPDLLFNSGASFNAYKNGSFKSITLSTTSKAHFDTVVADLKNSIYTDVDTYDEANGTRTEYTSDKHLSRIITVYVHNLEYEGTPFTEYIFELSEL